MLKKNYLSAYLRFSHQKVAVSLIGHWQAVAKVKAESRQNFYLEPADEFTDMDFCQSLATTYGYKLTWEPAELKYPLQAVFTQPLAWSLSDDRIHPSLEL